MGSVERVRARVCIRQRAEPRAERAHRGHQRERAWAACGIAAGTLEAQYTRALLHGLFAWVHPRAVDAERATTQLHRDDAGATTVVLA
eukprot:7290266-Prymnesium_polylepis.1